MPSARRGPLGSHNLVYCAALSQHMRNRAHPHGKKVSMSRAARAASGLLPRRTKALALQGRAHPFARPASRGAMIGAMPNPLKPLAGPPAYIDPISGETYPISEPRWRSDTGAPLMITALPGIGARHDRHGQAIVVALRSRAAGRGCRSDHDGRGPDAARRARLARRARPLQARVVFADRQLQGPGRLRHALDPARPGRNAASRGQLRKRRGGDCGLCGGRGVESEDSRSGLDS